MAMRTQTEYHNAKGDTVLVEIAMSVDNAKAFTGMVRRAMDSKTGTAKALGGAVTVRILSRHIAKTQEG